MEEQGSKHKKVESSPSPNPSSLAAKLQSPITMLSYLASLPVIAAAGWLMYMRNYDCEDILRMPGLRVGIGVSMIVLFLISNLVVFYGDRCLIAGFVLVMVPLVIMLTLGLAISGAYKAESQALPASPLWIRRRVANNHNWLKIKKCICDESRTCSNLAYKTAGFNLYDFRTKKLSLIEVTFLLFIHMCFTRHTHTQRCMLFYHIDVCLVYLIILIGHRCEDLLRITRLEEWSQHDHDSLSHHVTVDHDHYNSELISWYMSLIAICNNKVHL